MLFKKNLIRSSILMALLSNSAYAAEIYDPSKSYTGGTIVSAGGCDWEAKWYVNPNQSPINEYVNDWDSPWQAVDPSCKPETDGNSGEDGNDNGHGLNPEDYPEFSEGTTYQSGDIVRARNSDSLFQCLEGVAAWCSSSPAFYEPGVGTAWSSAWSLLSGDVPPVTPTPTPDPELDQGNGSEDSGTTTSFDYRNQVNGLTKSKVQYHDTGRIGAEKAIETSDKVVGGYVSEWAVYERGFDLERLSGKSYNRLVYAFAGICGDRAEGKASDTVRAECAKQGLSEHEMVILDPWAGFIKPISQRQADMPWHDSYDSNNPRIIPADKVRGLMGQLQHLKRESSELKVALSIGGWTLSEPFHRMAADQTSRDKFVGSVIDFIHKWDLDGVDIDWEFPGHGGESGKWTDDDGKNFAYLIRDMKLGLTALGKITGKTYEVSSAVGATEAYINKIGVYYKLVNQYIDNLYLMNYDYFGAWEKQLGHQSNLKPSSSLGANFSIEYAVKLLEEKGVNKDKIVLGVANYSRGAQAPLYTSSPIKSGPINNVRVFGTWEDTVIEGYDLFPNMAGSNMRGVNGWELRTDAEANADYFYNYGTQIFHSIDTPRTAYQKAKYAKENGLKGTFVWTVEQDFSGQVANAMNDGFGHRMTGLYTTPEERAELYNTCGDNISASECETLNGGQITVPESVEDPDRLLAVKHVHLKNKHILIKKWRAWEGDRVVHFSKDGFTAGLSESLINFKITPNTKIEALALTVRSDIKQSVLKVADSEEQADQFLARLADELDVNHDFVEKVKLYQQNQTPELRLSILDIVTDILGIPTSWGDLFLDIAINAILDLKNAFGYKHFGWVDMSQVIASPYPDVMVTIYEYQNIKVVPLKK